MASADELRELLRTEGAAIAANTQGFNDGRNQSVAKLDDYEALKREARATKEDAIEHLPELLSELTATVEENGGTVYVADDSEDANDYICDVVDDRAAERAVKRSP